MMKLAITNNKRTVDLMKEKVVYIPTPKAMCIMIHKPTFDITVNDITIGRMDNPCSKTLGRFLGMFIGDGWVDNGKGRGNMLHLASIHKNMIDFYRTSTNSFLRQDFSEVNGYHKENTSHDYFPDYKSTHGKFSINIRVPERDDIVNMFGHGANNKTFPDYFLNTPEEFRWGFLSGLIDTDGSISLHIRKQKNGKLKYNKDARYSTTSKDLANKVQLLAFSLGINASITTCLHKKTGVIEHITLFSTKHITEKKDKLQLFHEENAKALDQFFLSDRAYYKDVIPFDEDVFTMIKKENVGLPEPKLDRFRKSFRRGYVSRNNLEPFYRNEVKSLYDNRYNYNVEYEVVEKVV